MPPIPACDAPRGLAALRDMALARLWGVGLMVAAICAPLCAAADGGFVPQLPTGSVTLATIRQPLDSYALPTGPWMAGNIPVMRTEGPLRLTSWRVPDRPVTLALLQDLRAQVQAAGFRIVFECSTEDCGGFDFRFGTRVMPEPDMHVDLGDYRFLAAERSGDHGAVRLSVLVSRGAGQGYVQVAEAGGDAISAQAMSDDAAAGATLSTMSAPVADFPAPVTTPVPTPPELAQNLLSAPVVAEGISFAPSQSVLQGPLPQAWLDLARWLASAPGQTLHLVGYTDNSGNPDANLRLSDARAQALRRAMIAAGAPAGQITALGRGAENPVADNTTAEGRAKNRRVEAMLTPTR